MWFLIILDLFLICLLDESKAKSSDANETTVSFSPYFCKGAKDPELRLLRFIGHMGTFYVIFRRELIKFQIPTIGKRNNVTSYYLMNNPMVTVAKEEPMNDTLVGYTIFYDGVHNYMNVEEIHYDRMQFSYILLDFKKMPCARTNRIRTIKEQVKSLDYQLFIHFSFSSIWDFLIIYSNYTMIVIHTLSYKSELKFSNELDYRVVQAALYTDEENERCTILELDDRGRVHLHSFEPDQTSFRNEWHTLPVRSLASVLSCHQTATDYAQIKGIYFNTKSNIYYIFIDRFYLKIIGEDMVRQRFKIKSHHSSVIGDLRFRNESDLRTVNYLEPNFKWTRILGNELHFVFSDEQVFSAAYDYEFSVEVERSTSIDWIQSCPAQTLRIDEYVFCFVNEHYYLLKQLSAATDYQVRTYNTSNMFNNLNVDYDVEEPDIEFIFDYRDHRFVMMTKASIFVIDRNAVQVNRETFEITLFSDATSRVYKTANCLISCSHKLPTPPDETHLTLSTTSHSMVTSKTQSTLLPIIKLPPKIIWLLVILVAAILILVLCLLLIRKKTIFNGSNVQHGAKTGLRHSFLNLSKYFSSKYLKTKVPRVPPDDPMFKKYTNRAAFTRKAIKTKRRR